MFNTALFTLNTPEYKSATTRATLPAMWPHQPLIHQTSASGSKTALSCVCKICMHFITTNLVFL